MGDIYVCRPAEGDEHLLNTQWVHVLKAFDVEEISLEDIPPTLPVVVVQPQTARHVKGETSLSLHRSVKGPVVYLFGASHENMTPEDLLGLNVVDKVFIPLNNDWELFGPHAAAIVLWELKWRDG